MKVQVVYENLRRIQKIQEGSRWSKKVWQEELMKNEKLWFKMTEHSACSAS